MDGSINTETFRRIIDLIIFQQRFKANPQNIYEKFCEISKRMEKTENVNQTLRNENQKLILANEVFQRKILVREDQLKKHIFTPFTVSPQRNPKFPNPEQFGGARDKLKPFKFNMKAKFQTNGDWYLTEEGKLNYAFSRLKGLAQGQILPRMNPNNTYASPSAPTTMNTVPTQHQVTTTYTNPPPHLPTDQGDPMDLSATNRGFKKPLTAEQRKHRFENNLCLYCGKPGHKALDHKLTRFTQRINFVSEIFTPTPPAPAQFAIETPPATN